MRDSDLDRLWAPASDHSPVEDAIAQRLAADLKPVRPLPSGASLTLGFLLIVIAVAAWGAWMGGGHALARMNLPVELATFTLLSLSVALVASALTGQMVPAGRAVTRPWVLAGLILAVLAMLFATLFPFRPELKFWRHAWLCFSGGLGASAIAAIPTWLLLRRGAVLNPRACGALAGLLGGLTATAILEMDCSDFNAVHILVSHWGVALFCACAGWALGGLVRARG